MESLQGALGKGLGVAARISYKIFRSAVFSILFMLDEEDMELGIREDVDLLGLFLIYAPRHVQIARQLAGRAGRGFERKVTLENALRWVKEECDRRGTRHYDVLVNLPEDAEPPPEDVFPPHGYDTKRVKWFWTNVQRLLNYVLYGKVTDVTKKWSVEHLRWLKQQEEGEKTEIKQLLARGREESEARMEGAEQN
jgi:hypothetical protein